MPFDVNVWPEVYVSHVILFVDVREQVAALFGDARRALDICRRATELVDHNVDGKGIVKMVHVDAALQEMYSAPKIVAVRSVNYDLLSYELEKLRNTYQQLPDNDMTSDGAKYSEIFSCSNSFKRE